MDKILQGDCKERLKELHDNSVDAIITDPPYELGFMGKKWDNTGIAYNVDMWRECLRVLKPGGHLLAFGGTRTYHRMAVAIEDAGFEVRDMIEWVYGSGFPKSLNIGKAVDKLQGNERIKTGEIKHHAQKGVAVAEERGAIGGGAFGQAKDEEITKGNSEWEGWGTALKPSHEPICMARKPISEKTVAENCLKYGTGGINIDESRVETDGSPRKGGATTNGNLGWKPSKEIYTDGRFPANLIHDNSEEVRECFPETTHAGNKKASPADKGMFGIGREDFRNTYGNDGNSASRFFKSIIYQAKASKSERNKGCDGLEEKQYSHDGRDKEIENPYQRNKSVATNNHPTVKPIALMEYLIKMVTPRGGIVLDPFAGSGTTLVACKQNGYHYIGIELTEEYTLIIKARLKAVKKNLFS